MAIIGTRIDGRLVHGQVANLWASRLDISRFMVVDDDVAQNTVEKQGLKLATPSGVKLSVLPVAKATENILAGKYDSQRLLIIAKRPEVFVQLVEAGVPVEEINVGNMSQTDETRSVTRSINVTDEDVDNFRKLNEHGIKMYAQMVPSDRKEDFTKVLTSKE